jgi:cobalt/nickel transport system ATP-binding protein
VRRALGAVRMEHAAARAPHQLSMGERRRVAIAGVLAMQPRLLVLDEPSANLDPRARRELLDVLEALDRTLLVVTHDLPFAAELCERAVILSSGRVVADGRCPDVLGDTALLARHDLELPAGFDPARVTRRPRPAAVG